jgi:hypothetical protein
VLPGDPLEEIGLANGELNRVRTRLDQDLDSVGQVLDAAQESEFVEEAMIDRDVETAFGVRVKEAAKAIGFHERERRGGVMEYWSTGVSKSRFREGELQVSRRYSSCQK